MILDDSDDRFLVAPSRIPGAGQGLFARVALQAGDRLEVVGVLVRRHSVVDRCTTYADEYKYRAGDCVLIPFGVAAMANHSSHPNVEKVIEGEAVFLELLRDVGAGEELCLAYSKYARERFGIA
jgi:SET domain-containing protein